jgi:RecA/RadA recombinase
MTRHVEDQAAQIKKTIMAQRPDDERVEFLDSGSTMFNLAASGKGRDGGWARGRIVNPVGDGSSGKTLMALEFCANAYYTIKKKPSKIFPPVTKLYIVYLNRERVMDFPVQKMYNLKDADGNPIPSFYEAVEWIYHISTVEEFGRDFGRRAIQLQPGEALIYVVDSWDSMNSEEAIKRFEKEALEESKPKKKTSSDDEDGDDKKKGSYNLEKAAYASKVFFNNACDLMTGKDITLMIISQTRTKIGITFGDKHYRSGGDALNFYTHQVPWLAQVEELKRTFRGDTRTYGVRMKAKFKRNKVGKPFREAETTILFDYGVDDILSMINWYWGPKVQKIDFDGATFAREDLVAYIEENDLRDVLIDMCEKEWAEIEAEIVPKRKNRFE